MAKRHHVALGLLAGAVAAAGFMGDARAQNTQAVRPVTLTLAEGYGGEISENGGELENGGPGNEQPQSAHVRQNGKDYVVTVYMSSDVEEGYWQCKCSSVEMTENGPVLVANNVQITSNEGGYRPCNHPRIASDGENLAWVYGSDVADPDNTQIYAGRIDAQCNAPPAEMITNSPGNDVGAPYIAYVGKRDGVSYFVAAGHDNRGDDYAEAYGLQLGPNENGDVELRRTFYNEEITTPANVSRPVVAAFPQEDGDPMRALVCSSKGNQRPPEDGVICAWIDAETGETLSEVTVAESDEDQDIYYNMPSVAALSNGRFAVMVDRSNGGGKNNNDKGTAKAELFILEPSDTSITFKAKEDDLDLAWQTHAAICSGSYGVDGDVFIAAMGASITGVGQPKTQLIGWSPEEGVTLNKKDSWIVANYGDSGYMANIYGANPGNQGRDFLECIGNVPNPGYHKDGGFMPSVKTLFVQPIAGKPASDPKNALYMSFFPGQSDDPLEGAGPGEGGAGSGSGSADATANTATTGSSGAENAQADGCGCRTAPTERNTPTVLAVLGIGIALASRRRGRA